MPVRDECRHAESANRSACSRAIRGSLPPAAGVSRSSL